MSYEYDLTVIGGGPGGFEAAIRAAQLGLKTAIIEEREMGGTCLNRGCIPTKALLHSAEVYKTVRNSLKYGVVADNAGFDYAKIADFKDSVVRKLRQGVEFLLRNNKVDVIRGRGVIKDKNNVEVSGTGNRVVSTGKIIIATGSRPLIPPIPGIDGSKVLDSDDVLSLKECPDSVVIIGGGVIGVEFATIFNSLGKKVIIIEMMNSILPAVDSEISASLKKLLEKRGVSIYTGSRVVSIKSEPSAVCVFEKDGKTMQAEGDIVISAIGRKPNSEKIGLENVNVDSVKGYINVNDKMETTAKGIYAIGDVTGKVLLAHVASAQGLIAAANAAGQDKRMDYSAVPGCIYTDPEIASVGLTEAEAIKRGYNVKIGNFPVNANGRSMIMGENEGLTKIITDGETGEIFGAHVFSPRATDIISEITLAMNLESTINEVADTIHPHPTISEMIMEAAHDVDGLLCKQACKKTD